MKRRIIHIDEEKCNGCGLCADACHEGAIGMVEGKAKLLREDYCDGLGDCLPACPAGAISFEKREADPYDEKAVMENKQRLQEEFQKKIQRPGMEIPTGCPGSQARAIQPKGENSARAAESASAISQLRQWPVQIKLAPVNAPYFQGAKLLIAADCTAYAYGAFHEYFMKDHITLIGCPKLDSVDYAQKLTEIIKNNEIKSVKIVRMEVPCCGGLEHAVKTALKDSEKFIPWSVAVISTDGNIIDE